MNIIRFFMSKDFRRDYTMDFSDKLEKEQQQQEAAYRESLDKGLN